MWHQPRMRRHRQLTPHPHLAVARLTAAAGEAARHGQSALARGSLRGHPPLQKPTRLLGAAPWAREEWSAPRRTAWVPAVAPWCLHTAADSAAHWPTRCRDEAEDELARLQAELQESVYEQEARPRSTAPYSGGGVESG